jgi:ElaB/YqjD/DUF883 family membrane-anchored ribosome-binding protein
MITETESSKSILEMNLPERVFESFNQANTFLQSTIQQTKSLAANAQQAVNIITTATNKAVDTVNAAAKNSLEQTLQKADQVSDFTSNAMQTAISNSVSEWLQAHPTILRLTQLLIWATNHPVVSIVILIFVVAIAWSLTKAIARLFEQVSLSLLQAPLKLVQLLFAFSAKFLGKFSGLASNKPITDNNTEITVLQLSSSNLVYQDKQQRIAEISTRLEAIQNEQNELLQEIAAILASDKINREI